MSGHTTHINGDLAWQLPNGTFWYAGGDYNNCTISVCPVTLSVYGYRPSLAASGTLIALYAIFMSIQIALGFKYKTWWFMYCMVLGCIDEILGYAGRILYNQDPWGQTGFIMQIVLITIGPVFFSGAIYVLLSKIVENISIKHSRIAPKWYVWTFIPCDIISLVLQAAGGALSSTSNGSSTAGVNIALAGLSFQVATLVAFVVLVVDFFIRSRSVWMGIQFSSRFKIFVVALAAATIFILIRCVYRVYELSQGYSQTSEALRSQTEFIVLESVMVILATFCLIFAHPGDVFNKLGSPSDEEKGGYTGGNHRDSE